MNRRVLYIIPGLILLIILIFKLKSDEVVINSGSEKEVSFSPSRFYKLRKVFELKDDPKSITLLDDGFLVVHNMGFTKYSNRGEEISSTDLVISPDFISIYKSNLIICDRDGLKLYSGEGKFLRSIYTFSKERSITSQILVNDSIYLADFNLRELLKVHIETGVDKIVKGYSDKRFIIPSPYFDITRGSGSTLWATDTGRHKVVLLNSDLNYIDSWGSASYSSEDFVGCCNPTQIDSNRKGEFVTGEKGLTRVKLYNNRGDLIDTIANPDDFRFGGVIKDLKIDSESRVLLIFENELRIYERD